jgi:hypothetical protein
LLHLSAIAGTQAGRYEVTASNIHGIATNAASLVVRSKPELRVTEVQSSAAPGPSAPVADWWELTNFETQAVDLSGWRFNDAAGGWTEAIDLGADLEIAAGETVVFVETLTAAQFRDWWGHDNVPANVRIRTYHGSGVSFSAGGDGVRLWDPSAVEPFEPSVMADFGPALPGVTFNFDPVSRLFGTPSTLGIHGVFQAIAGSDVGSPGRILAPAAGPRLRILPSGEVLRIEFAGAVGRRYALETIQDWRTGTWMPTGDGSLATNDTLAVFVVGPAAVAEFFRVRVE